MEESRYGERSSRYVWYVIALLSVVNVFNYMDRMALSVLLPAIKSDLQLSDSQLGLLVGFAFSMLYAVCGIPIARWADHGVRRSIIAIALATWSAMTAISGAAQSFAHLFAARVGVGIGEAGCLSPSQSLLCDYVEFERRSAIFSLHTLGLMLGLMLGMTFAGWLGATIGWRWAFVVLGLPGIAVAIIVQLTLREPQRGVLDKPMQRDAGQSLGSAIRFMWGCRTYRLFLCYGAANGLLQYGLNQWWPSFYARIFELSLQHVGVYLGFALGIGSMAGLLLGGFVANRASRRDARCPLLIGAGAMLLSLPSVLASLFVSSVELSIVLVALSGMLWYVATGPVAAALFSVVPSQMRATAGSINILFTSVLGFGFGPFLTGLLSDALTPMYGEEALRYAMLAPVCALPFAVGALCAATTSLRRDLQVVGAVA